MHHLLELSVIQGEIVFEFQSKMAIMLGPDEQSEGASEGGQQHCILSDKECFQVGNSINVQ